MRARVVKREELTFDVEKGDRLALDRRRVPAWPGSISFVVATFTKSAMDPFLLSMPYFREARTKNEGTEGLTLS